MTTLVRLPPSGVRVRSVHAENGGILPSGLPVAGGSFVGSGRSGAPHATRTDTPPEIPVLYGSRSADPRGWPVSRALAAVSGGSNCQQGRREGKVPESSLGLYPSNSEPGLLASECFYPVVFVSPSCQS